ncbi:MAG: hypothetical protein AABX03_04830 [Nanoarchaeota archaeon]
MGREQLEFDFNPRNYDAHELIIEMGINYSLKPSRQEILLREKERKEFLEKHPGADRLIPGPKPYPYDEPDIWRRRFYGSNILVRYRARAA